MPQHPPIRLIFISMLGVALLSACGGGSSSDEPTSEACFNEGFYRTGASIQVLQSNRLNGAAATESTLIHRVSSVQEEGGIRTIFVVPDTGRTSLQYSIQNGALLYHGSASLGIGFSTRSALAPAQQSVIALEPGQATTQDIVQTDDYNTADNSTRTISQVAYSRSYTGRQTLSVALGQFDTCQFVERKRISVVDNATANRDVQTTTWVAANGAYRGLTLKTESVTRTAAGTQTSVSEAVRVNQFDIK